MVLGHKSRPKSQKSEQKSFVFSFQFAKKKKKIRNVIFVSMSSFKQFNGRKKKICFCQQLP